VATSALWVLGVPTVRETELVVSTERADIVKLGSYGVGAATVLELQLFPAASVRTAYRA
jgi:hypothetical protein